MNTEEKDSDRWARVKKKITSLWSEVSDEELERTRGNISAISNLILKKYDVSKQDVANKLVDVMHATTNDEDLEHEDINTSLQ